ncbi:unnamed protein product [Strongylus vulgaris]|uniref:Uncharacterized protein n=1 Tax=Strongylus vulgaris TaxID=40348 RepID=A0A3P7L624_STRVU|nr:unnamed protein product [Strongylus vulgaris]
MESIMMRFCANLFRSSTPVSYPVIPTEGIPPWILPETRAAIQPMKAAPVAGPDHVWSISYELEDIAYTRYLLNI